MLPPPARMGDNGKRQLTTLRGITEGIYRDSATEKRVKFILEARNSTKVTYPQYNGLAASERTVRIPDEKSKRCRTASQKQAAAQSHLFCNNIIIVRRILLASSPSVLKISLLLFLVFKIKFHCYNNLSFDLFC